MKSIESTIINALIEKGGLYGEIANLNKNDLAKSQKFIFECHEQLKHKIAVKFFEKN